MKENPQFKPCITWIQQQDISCGAACHVTYDVSLSLATKDFPKQTKYCWIV